MLIFNHCTSLCVTQYLLFILVGPGAASYHVFRNISRKLLHECAALRVSIYKYTVSVNCVTVLATATRAPIISPEGVMMSMPFLAYLLIMVTGERCLEIFCLNLHLN